MKKIITCAILLAMAATSFCQETNPTQPVTSTDYLKKSKKQKTIAWILAGTGVGVMVTAVATTSVNDWFNSVEGDHSGLNTGAALFVIGGIAALSSIPFFIASGKNRRKAAASVSFKIETSAIISQWAFSDKPYPAVAIRVRL